VDTDGQPVTGYGIAVDPLHPYLWQTTGNDSVFRWNTNGTPVTNADGTLQTFYHGDGTAGKYDGHSQGLAVDAAGQVWVAHEKGVSTHTVGHLDTNGVWLGNVELFVTGLWTEYFDNTSLAGWPILTTTELGPLDYTNGWPTDPVPINRFSARWSGLVEPQTQGDHVFYVSADAGAAFRLTVNGTILIDNWTNPASGPVELAGTNWLGTNAAYGLKLEYANFTNSAQITLSWLEPGMTNREVIPQDRMSPYGSDNSHYWFSAGATGISVDASGKIWAGCYDSDTAVRIDPNAGPMVAVTNVIAGVTNIVTNYVGLVDLVVDLGDGGWYPSPYNVEAQPYNYSDMTGFNERVVNPGLKPLKGYWMVVNDSGNLGQLWNKVCWTAASALTNGCSVEVYVRAADERTDLSLATFVQATNNTPFPSIRGRFIEVRLGMTRDDPSKQPILYDLTLYGVSSGFAGDYFLYDQWADEGSNAVFSPDLAGAEPMTYQWFIQCPWMTNLVKVAGATGSTFTITNVDSWVDQSQVSCLVSNGNGETVWLGPAFLDMVALTTYIPDHRYTSGSGSASRYPMTINVFDQPTSLNNVIVTLWDLSHTRSADLNFLLLSPSGKRIILMSNVGGTNGVSNAGIRFWQSGTLPLQPDPIPSWPPLTCLPSNFGQSTPPVPFGLPAGAYSSNLDDLKGDDPNGVWKLYIYDDVQPGGIGQLYGSWSLNFTFQ
jgi:subtilisin-like proprotein convertase family protein